MATPTYNTTIASVREVAPEVRELTLAPPPEPLAFEAGQWIGLHLPIGERPPLVRAYTLAAPPAPSGELVLCLDRVPDGEGSRYLFDLNPGDEVTFAGPLGNFVLPKDAGELLWIARYTGIVPLRAMLLQLEQRPEPPRVTLLYSAPRPADLVYHGELAAAAERLPWLELVAVVDEPAEGWTGAVGPAVERLPEVLQAVEARSGARGFTPMICGKREFVRPAREFFHERGWERRSVKWESYD